MAEHRYYKGDTYPPIAYKMIYEDHQPVDIQGCNFEMKIKDTQPPAEVRTGTGAFQISNGLEGRFGYYPSAEDTQIEGRFELIVHVTFPSTEAFHIPDPLNMVVQSLA